MPETCNLNQLGLPKGLRVTTVKGEEGRGAPAARPAAARQLSRFSRLPPAVGFGLGTGVFTRQGMSMMAAAAHAAARRHR